MLFIPQGRRAVVAFLLSLALAVLASAVSVAFGSGAYFSQLPEATAIKPASEPASTEQPEESRASIELQHKA